MLQWIEEHVFNSAANGIADMVLSLALGSAWLDTQVINRSVMASAAGIDVLSGKARRLQTGKVYHYLAAVFAWVIVIAIIAFAVR